jgi:hypothetical protein
MLNRQRVIQPSVSPIRIEPITRLNITIYTGLPQEMIHLARTY